MPDIKKVDVNTRANVSINRFKPLSLFSKNKNTNENTEYESTVKEKINEEDSEDDITRPDDL